ncbi:hypothetical protein H4582DRAFT_1306565, partial [Lactarius indigo]
YKYGAPAPKARPFCLPSVPGQTKSYFRPLHAHNTLDIHISRPPITRSIGATKMSFPAEAPSVRPPWGQTGRLRGRRALPSGSPQPGIVVGDPAQLSSRDPSYMHIGLTHVLIRTTVHPFTRTPTATPGAGIEGIAPLVFGERQSLREVVELLVRVRSCAPARADPGRRAVRRDRVPHGDRGARPVRDVEARDGRGTRSRRCSARCMPCLASLRTMSRRRESGSRAKEELIELRRQKLQLQQAEQRCGTGGRAAAAATP